MPCCICFKTAKHKRVIDQLYPKNLDGDIIDNNVSNMTLYALTEPNSLPDIGQYLQTRIYRDFQRKRIRHVEIGMEAAERLIMSSHGKLGLFALYVENCMKLLFKQSNDRLRRAAAKTFVTFCGFLQEPIDFGRARAFVTDLVAMSRDTSADAATRASLRASGLQAVHRVISQLQKALSSEWEEIIPAIVENLTPGVAEPDSAASVAAECLQSIAQVTDSATLPRLLEPLFEYFKTHQTWRDGALLPQECMRLIITSVTPRVAWSLLSTLASVDDDKAGLDVQTRSAFINVLTAAITRVRANVFVPDWGMRLIVVHLLRLLVNAVKAQKDDAADTAVHAQLQQAVQTCISTFAASFKHASHRLQLLVAIAEKRLTGTEEEERGLRFALVDSIARAAAPPLNDIDTSDFPSEILLPLAGWCVHPLPDVRYRALQALRDVLALGAMPTTPVSIGSLDAARAMQLQPSQRQVEVICAGVHRCGLATDNPPAVFAAMSALLAQLLLFDRTVTTIISLLFSWQERLAEVDRLPAEQQQELLQCTLSVFVRVTRTAGASAAADESATKLPDLTAVVGMLTPQAASFGYTDSEAFAAQLAEPYSGSREIIESVTQASDTPTLLFSKPGSLETRSSSNSIVLEPGSVVLPANDAQLAAILRTPVRPPADSKRRAADIFGSAERSEYGQLMATAKKLEAKRQTSAPVVDSGAGVALSEVELEVVTATTELPAALLEPFSDTCVFNKTLPTFAWQSSVPHSFDAFEAPPLPIAHKASAAD
eukprot:TRINITY_DN11327_c0_g1_i1.p1 TRINITY_DN11327_c0_g1~~TRINITY_DN11327_c0_g1_i1.p1  ORF type:complete len:770 (-),score=192.85 TRINITY_DN11327_c0_g1_i1:36-2345(-)